MNMGGAETFLMKIYREIDRTKYQMDFCVNDVGYYDEEIIDKGGHIFTIPMKTRYPIKSFKAISDIVKENKYEYVLRVNEHSLATIDLIAGKIGGAKVLAMRSSNASSEGSLTKMLHYLFRWMTLIVPNVKIAPSELAAHYTFGSRGCKDTVIIKNGLDIQKFSYNDKSRNEFRSEYGLKENIVIGHIGRFSEQKNHKFLIDIFKAFSDFHSEARLVMIGSGPLLESTKEYAKALKIQDKCLFMGQRSDIDKVLCGFDIFVFPSLYEGMPNTVIEAQCAGLKCLISNTITEEAIITPLVMNNDLSFGAQDWAKKIDEMLCMEVNREQFSSSLEQAGYAISDVVDKFVQCIFEH